MEQHHLSDSEYRLLQVVWASEPVASGQLVTLCGERLGWKKSTTYTVLKKLCDKGVLRNQGSTVTSAVPRAAVDHRGGGLRGQDLRRFSPGVPHRLHGRAEADGKRGGGFEASH